MSSTPSDAEFRLKEALGRVEELEAAIRHHRYEWESGDRKCWKDNEELYKLLPEGFVVPERDTFVELHNCIKYLQSCHHPEVQYVSPQTRIEELEEQNKNLTGCNLMLEDRVETLVKIIASRERRIEELEEKVDEFRTKAAYYEKLYRESQLQLWNVELDSSSEYYKPSDPEE